MYAWKTGAQRKKEHCGFDKEPWAGKRSGLGVGI